MPDNLDKFYTKPRVAKSCYDRFISVMGEFLGKKSVFIEPSAGAGSFLSEIKYQKLGYDISPEHTSVYQLDFLREKIDITADRTNVFILGNPPFGKRSSLATQFINRANIYSKTIGFILPIHFLKYSAQRLVNKSLRLVYSENLPENSFTENDKDYRVRSVFQIWSELDIGLQDQRILTPPATAHEDFDMWQYNNTKEALKYFDKDIYGWEFAVPRQGFYDYSKKITKTRDLNTKIQWAFFKPKIDIARDILYNKMDFEKLARKNTAILGFGKADVVEKYLDLKKEFSKLYT